MYSDKENINILTSLLAEHEVNFAVVCPGSRNAPIAHNLNAAGIECLPVTDERSAGFYALGLSLKLSCKPVAVCVTSGSALLNLIPAAAEAYYQHVPLIIISADRPAAWIDQQDGQTLPQANALWQYALKSVNLPEPQNEEERWFCNRLVNEAITASTQNECGPVHINVPISEPLYNFTTEKLQKQRKITIIGNESFKSKEYDSIIKGFMEASRPMIVLGQNRYKLSEEEAGSLRSHCAVITESLSGIRGITHADEILYSKAEDNDYQPDFVLYAGGTLVSKRPKTFLRNVGCGNQYIVNESGKIYDTFTSLRGVIQASPEFILRDIAERLKEKSNNEEQERFIALWNNANKAAEETAEETESDYSQAYAVKEFEKRIDTLDEDSSIFYANSSAVRLANIFSHRQVECNRGVNGIEGSLSTAAGASLAIPDLTFCVIGDLSFFYDQNALWNQNIGGNLRIMLLNNSGGGIFEKFEGLKRSPVRNQIVMAEHNTSAEGICSECDIHYISANDKNSLAAGLDELFTEESSSPILLEVFTNSEQDIKALTEYYKSIKI